MPRRGNNDQPRHTVAAATPPCSPQIRNLPRWWANHGSIRRKVWRLPMTASPRSNSAVIDRREKTPVKTAAKNAATNRAGAASADLVSQHHGGALLKGGQVGNKGGSGRPPNEWKQLCQSLASREEMIEHAQRVLNNPDHPAWLGAWRFVT